MHGALGGRVDYEGPLQVPLLRVQMGVLCMNLIAAKALRCGGLRRTVFRQQGPAALAFPLRKTEFRHWNNSVFRVQGSGFKFQGSEFRVQGSGFRVDGLGFNVQVSGFRVQGSGCRVQGSGLFRVQGKWFIAQGSGFEIEGSGYRIQGLGFRI